MDEGSQTAAGPHQICSGDYSIHWSGWSRSLIKGPSADELRNEGFYFGYPKPDPNNEITREPLSMDMIRKAADQIRATIPMPVRSVCVWTEEDRIFYAMKGFKVFDLREAENGTITVTEWKNPPAFPSWPPRMPEAIQ